MNETNLVDSIFQNVANYENEDGENEERQIKNATIFTLTTRYLEIQAICSWARHMWASLGQYSDDEIS